MLVEMSDSSTSRTYELVEELRAEIDFELVIFMNAADVGDHRNRS
jgi:hypothetical protein